MLPLSVAQFLLPPSLPEGSGEQVVLDVIDAQTREAIVNATLVLEVGEGGAKKSYMLYTGEEGKVSLVMPAENVAVVGKINDPASEGSDYVSYSMELQGAGGELLMWPSGSVRGVVRAASGELVPDATVGASCASDYGEKSARSDEAGAFQLQYLPVGNCKITAAKDAAVGSASVVVEKGRMGSASLQLGEKVLAQGS
ncbi:MAG: carboxypeptidase-like regulatory domain-containing protein, partial [Candidatus Micrarchaeia archaeon]